MQKENAMRRKEIARQAVDGPWEDLEPAAALAVVLMMQQNKTQQNEMQCNEMQKY